MYFCVREKKDEEEVNIDECKWIFDLNSIFIFRAKWNERASSKMEKEELINSNLL